MNSFCGTNKGYNRHIAKKEIACDACNQSRREYQNSWSEKNREKKREYARNWNKQNKEYRRTLKRENSRKRRAQKRNNQHDKYTEAEGLEKYGSICHICMKEIDLTAPRATSQKGWEIGLHIDHVISLLKGGSDTLENVRPSHGQCNLSKGSK